MRSFQSVPQKVREGEVLINGHAVMAFLADYREDGGQYVVEDIIIAAGVQNDPRITPPAFINSNRAYIDELARVTKCKIDALIGMRSDGRYWCCHQVAVKLAAWVSPKLAVAFDRALIQFAKNCMSKTIEWIDKRGDSKIVAKHYNDMCDSDIDNPAGKDEGMKYGVMHNAIQKPFNSAQGGPSNTSTFKEINNVSSAMDAYDTPWLVGVTLARSVTISNVKRHGIRNLWKAKDEAEDNAKQISEKIGQLLNKSSGDSKLRNE